MAVDSRYKRASAISLVIPSMFTTHTDTTSGVDSEERWFVTWMYNGISVGAPVIVLGIKRGLLLGVHP